MAKDPAFLFYPGDWMGGTMIFTRHQKGCYIDLLIAQFNNGPLSLESIKTILGQDQATWTILSSKFKKDSAGNYFNERLAAEIEKRKKFSNNQSERVKKRWKKDKGEIYPGINSVSNGHIPIIESENRNENVIQEGVAGEGFLIPQILQTWYQSFPTYTKSKTDDYPAVLRIINFMIEQHGLKGVSDDESKEKIKNTFAQISEEIKKDQFWINKPIKSIANNIQEFYNKIKNPQNDKSTGSLTKIIGRKAGYQPTGTGGY